MKKKFKGKRLMALQLTWVILLLATSFLSSVNAWASLANDEKMKLYVWPDEVTFADTYGVLIEERLFRLACDKKMPLLVEQGFGFNDLFDATPADFVNDEPFKAAYQKRDEQPVLPCKREIDSGNYKQPRMIKIVKADGSYDFFLRIEFHNDNLFRLGCMELVKQMGLTLDAAREWDIELLEDFPAVNINCFSGTPITIKELLNLESFDFTVDGQDHLLLQQGKARFSLTFNKAVEFTSVVDSLRVWRVSGNGEKTSLDFSLVIDAGETEAPDSELESFFSNKFLFEVMGNHEGYKLFASLRGRVEDEEGDSFRLNQLAAPEGVLWPMKSIQVISFGFLIDERSEADLSLGFAALKLVLDRRIQTNSLIEALKVTTFQPGVGATPVGFDVYSKNLIDGQWTVIFALQGNHNGKNLRAELNGTLLDELGGAYPIQQEASPNDIYWPKNELGIQVFKFATAGDTIKLQQDQAILEITFEQPIQVASLVSALKIKAKGQDGQVVDITDQATFASNTGNSREFVVKLSGVHVDLHISAVLDGTLILADGTTQPVHLTSNPAWTFWMTSVDWLVEKADGQPVFVFYHGAKLAMVNNGQLYKLKDGVEYQNWAAYFGLTPANTLPIASEALFQRLTSKATPIDTYDADADSPVKFYESVDALGVKRVLVSLNVLGASAFELDCIEQYQIWSGFGEKQRINSSTFENFKAPKLLCGSNGTALNEKMLVSITLPEGFEIAEGERESYVAKGKAFRLVAKKECYPDIVVDYPAVDNDKFVQIAHPDILKFNVTLQTSTANVSFSQKVGEIQQPIFNPSMVITCGAALSIQAQKDGYRGKTISHDRIMSDQTLDFGELERIAYTVNVVLPEGYTISEGQSQTTIFHGERYILKAQRECFPPIEIEENDVQADIEQTIPLAEKLRYSVQFRSQTPGVTYDFPNPSEVECGASIAVTASKEGYQEKLQSVENVMQDEMVDFGYLEAKVFSVAFISSTPGVKFDRANPSMVAYGQSITVTASKTGYFSVSKTISNVTGDMEVDFGELLPSRFLVTLSCNTPGVIYRSGWKIVSKSFYLKSGGSFTITAHAQGYLSKTEKVQNIQQDTVVDFGDLDIQSFRIDFSAAPSGVAFDKPNPSFVPFGGSITVTASRSGYHSKTMTLNNVKKNQTLNFGTLQVNAPAVDPCKGLAFWGNNTTNKASIPNNKLWSITVYKQGNACYMKGTKKDGGLWAARKISVTKVGGQWQGTGKWSLGGMSSKTITVKYHPNASYTNVEEMSFPAIAGTPPTKWVFKRTNVIHRPLPFPRPIFNP